MEAKIHCKFDELLDPKKLKDHPKNRNKHGSDQIERLAELYKYHGIRHPIIVSTRSKCIVAGHGRKLAAIRAGIKIPVVYQDFESDEAEYAFIQSDNAIALWSDLDISAINADLGDLGPDFNIDMLGIKDFTLDVAEKEGLTDPDEVPEVVEPKAKLGQIYKLGEHRLMCGDSTSIEAVEKLMNREKANFVFTDPPYGVGFQYNKHEDKGGAEYVDFIRKIWHILSSMNCPMVLTPGNVNLNLWLKFSDFKLACWVKKNAMSPASNAHLNLFEIILTYNVKQKRNTDLFEYSVKQQKDVGDHPCPKILDLVVDAIDSWAPTNAILFEPFGGSGSTLIACEKTNRKCFMMELDPHYIDVIIARWEKFTGKKAELIHG